MIHYQLRCETGHEFDGWFAGSAAFERQAEQRLIACPVCAGTSVTRALMAPNLARRGRVIEHDPNPAPTAEARPGEAPSSETLPLPAMARAVTAASGAMPDAVRAVLTKLRAEVEKHCDYVGADFAAEARKIHNGEAPPRGIYGESTEAQAEALADEGIEVARIPWIPRADS
jgi:hypothetical protein